MCFYERRPGRLNYPCVFVEDAQEDTLLHEFLWKTLKLIKKHILYYIFSSVVRLPQKHNGFSVFFRVFHKNTSVSASLLTSSAKTHGFGLLPPSSFNMCTCICVCACVCVYVYVRMCLRMYATRSINRTRVSKKRYCFLTHSTKTHAHTHIHVHILKLLGGRRPNPCVFAEDVKRDAETDVFLWKTRKKTLKPLCFCGRRGRRR